jgi:hypothetical protein
MPSTKLVPKPTTMLAQQWAMVPFAAKYYGLQ